MNTILTKMKLCGVLPCVRAERAETLANALEALASQGFPCAEADMTAWRYPDPGAIPLERAGIEIGVRVRDWAEARQALRTGARWATILPGPGETPPVGRMLFPADSANPAHAPAPPADGHSRGRDGQPVVCDAGTPETMRPNNSVEAMPIRDCAAAETSVSGLPVAVVPIRDCADVETLASGRLDAEIPMRGCADAQTLVQGCTDPERTRRLLALPGVAAVRWPLAALPGKAGEQAENLKRVWALTLGFSLAHIGINSTRAGESEEIAQSFATLLGMPYTPGPASDYAGTLVEAMKAGGRGAHGHIGIQTDCLERGMYFATRSGFAFDPDSRKNDASGRAILYYLDREIGGFAIHLLQRQGG
ncbi:MAG: hypothetical protein GX418_10830 [Clostridiales bacterium]|nr:hypothetical protein [Clostridiales bacterium]